MFGAIHLGNIIRNSQFLEGPYLKTVQNTISRNAFFAHPENVLLSMLNDDDENIRCRAWQKILEIRKTQSNEGIRRFDLPRLNFRLNNYLDMIDFDQETRTVPPVLRNFKFPVDDAKYYAEMKLGDHDLGFDINKLPCHTQSVERCVKIVTEASRAVCGEDRRNGYIINTLHSRNVMPRFRTKKDFNLDQMSTLRASI